ncbi:MULTISPECIES: RES family NAD+ phosphorylase [Vibrio]|uniref:RES family NAD+ phosphorylase n=1 Tax=Vibrio TaxID=662 RepID=UPI002270809D|nr:RES family NAD+ phosphorylase [Vibrio lentus]MCC4838043.1 RES family NAD+ phosphorylase [Vibrio lentus]
MITIYRIVKEKRADTAMDGNGARLYGGRWNSIGRPAVYVAGSESLAILEILVHLKNTKVLDSYVLFTLELDEEDALLLNNEDLPSNWKEEPAPLETAEIGDQWLSSNNSLALAVPSVVVPRELNYILNINHPNFDKLIKTMKRHEISIDTRLV